MSGIDLPIASANQLMLVIAVGNSVNVPAARFAGDRNQLQEIERDGIQRRCWNLVAGKSTGQRSLNAVAALRRSDRREVPLQRLCCRHVGDIRRRSDFFECSLVSGKEEQFAVNDRSAHDPTKLMPL